jgi:hypothetical protein
MTVKGRRVEDGLVRLYSPEDYADHVTKVRRVPIDVLDSELLGLMKKGLVSAGMYDDGMIRFWWTEKEK